MSPAVTEVVERAEGPRRPPRLVHRLRGAVAISAAKAWFLVVGLLQTVLLPAVMGQAGFGTYRRALAFVNVVNAVVVVGSLQSVSRAVSRAAPAERWGTVRRVLPIHAAAAFGLGGCLFVAAPAISEMQHAPQLLPPLRVLALVVVAYGIYAPLVGALNGLGRFGSQAVLDVTASTLRTVLSVGCAAWFVRGAVGVAGESQGALGASVGFLASCTLLIPLAWLALPRQLRSSAGAGLDVPRLPVDAYVKSLAGLLLLQVLQALLLQFDLMVLGRAATLRLHGGGLDWASAGRRADQLAAVYAQSQSFGLVPFQLLLAATHVLFPAIAEAHAKGDRALLRARVRDGGRAALLVGGALVAALAGAPAAVLRVAFGGVPQVASSPGTSATIVLQLLTAAHLVTALATLGTTLLAAAGQFRRALTGTALLTMAAGLGVALAAWSSTVAGQLPERIAGGLLAGLAAGAVWTLASVHRHLGPLVRIAVFGRVLVALAFAVIVGRQLPLPAARLACGLLPMVPMSTFALAVWLLGERGWRPSSRSSGRDGDDHVAAP